MSDLKHTPGPWAIAKVYRGGGDEIVTTAKDIDGSDYRIACPGSGGAMSFTGTVCRLDWRNTDEWNANAALIAAAPDLLAALDLFVERDAALRRENPDLTPSARFIRLLEAGEAALAKARS